MTGTGSVEDSVTNGRPDKHLLSALHLDNIKEVAVLEALVSPEPWSAKLFAGELEVHASARNWMVAHSVSHRSQEVPPAGESEPKLVGFGGMMFVDNEGHLMNIAVDPGHQGQGLATKILLTLTRDAIARGITDLTLEVRANNQEAGALYRRFGYGPVGVRKSYYVDGEDALIMWAHDVDGEIYTELLSDIDARVAARRTRS